MLGNVGVFEICEGLERGIAFLAMTRSAVVAYMGAGDERLGWTISRVVFAFDMDNMQRQIMEEREHRNVHKRDTGWLWNTFSS